MKIGLRVLLGYFLIVAVAALLLVNVFVQQVKPGVRQAMEDTLADTANVLAELASDDLLAGRIDSGQFAGRIRAMGQREIRGKIWGQVKHAPSYRISVTDARGIVVYDSAGRDLGRDNSRWNDVHRTLRGEYGARSTRDDPDDEMSSVMYVAAPIRDGEGRIVGVLTVSKPNRSIQPFIERSQNVILRWGWVLLGSALLVGLLMAWWLSRQLAGLRRYADAVSAGQRASLPERGIEKPAGEFADLGRALESMRRQLDGKQYVEQYVHSLTHELKSPLAAIRAAAELLESPLPDADRARFAASIGSQSRRMATMVDKLLALAEVEHRQRIERPESLDIAALAREVVDDAASHAQAAQVRIEAHAGEGLPTLQGDAFLLRRMLANLVDNAIDFSPADGVVELYLQADADALRIEVADRGPGIPDYALERVFERFYSLPRPAGGNRSSGLGLNFVAEIAKLHGGHAQLQNRDGGGAVAKVILPLG
ncbi:two-component system sensor histidine kinase CreC [Thermomonas carbonis]|uniref:histidine kinase n=1 Tax=Thermomonas carbonis TaxID=1463158 RepID=A0A7G9SNP1_9GAMM|nr:two-component system sensor histidine kinase CreC [Thermomonas carbonis]QNN69466.1 two-component system sensor histidine kinase CreC [Thermomonas carbonis]GHB93300.1 two-component sensor histidine kinase [Thermomonas carbonis]